MAIIFHIDAWRFSARTRILFKLLHLALRLYIKVADQGNASPQKLGVLALQLLCKVLEFDAQPITGALCPYECWIAQSRLFAPLRATEKRYPLTGRLLFPADRILTVSPAITDGRWRLRDATALPLVTRRRLWIGLKVIARGISGTV